MYGLKQSSRRWYKKFHQNIGEVGFVPNNADACFYNKCSVSDNLYLSLYLDYILVVGDELAALNEIK